MFLSSLIVLILQIGANMAQVSLENYDVVNNFTYKAYKVSVPDNTENWVASLFSNWMTLSMVVYGAGGKTEEQMVSGLGLDTDRSIRERGGIQMKICETLSSIDKSELAIASTIFFDERLNVKSSFKSLVKSIYKSDEKSVDFQNVERASKTINDWVEEHTNSKIKDFINPDDLSTETTLVIVNAMSFVGNWLHKFNPTSTEPAEFFLSDGTVKNVPTMNIKKSFRYGTLEDLPATFIVVPYEKTGKMHESSMVIIYPDESSNMTYIEDNLEKIKLNDILSADFEEIILHLPKFKLESKTNLKPAMIKLGMSDMFHVNANFTGIADYPLKIAKIIHKVSLEVNENGASGTSATAIELQSRQMSLHVSINRPFLVFICTKNYIIFTGRVMEPKY